MAANPEALGSEEAESTTIGSYPVSVSTTAAKSLARTAGLDPAMLPPYDWAATHFDRMTSQMSLAVAPAIELVGEAADAHTQPGQASTPLQAGGPPYELITA